jgi:hypothetical protein
MAKFKVGDRVKVLDAQYDTHLIGTICTICDVENGIKVVGSYGAWNNNTNKLELVEESINNKELNMKEKFITMFLSEPEKSFRKAGITNGDGMLTDDGVKMFMTWMLKKNGLDFKAEVVDELLKEEVK